MTLNLGGDEERSNRDNVHFYIFGNLAVALGKFRRGNSLGEAEGGKMKDV